MNGDDMVTEDNRRWPTGLKKIQSLLCLNYFNRLILLEFACLTYVGLADIFFTL